MKLIIKLKFLLLIVLILVGFPGFTQFTIYNNGVDITNLGNLYINGSYENYNSGGIANGGTIYVTKDILNSSDSTLFITDTGRVVLHGNGLQNISGTRHINFYDLKIDKSSGEVVLSNNIRLSDTLNLLSGNINLNGKTIDLGTKGLLVNEKNSSRVYGKTGIIKTTQILGTSTININIAGLGLYIACNSSIGSTKIDRGHFEQNSNGDTSIFRFFNIYPADTLDIDSIKISYLASEAIPGESTYKLYTSDNSGVDWFNVGGRVDTLNNYIISSTIPSFKNFAISVFPIENFATCLPTDPNYITAVFLVPGQGLFNGDSIKFVQLSKPVPTDYSWDFGDLYSSSTEYSPIHVYHLQNDTVAAAYLTSLKVSNGICSDIRKKKLLISPKPPQKIGMNAGYIGFQNVNLFPNPSTGLLSLEIDITIETEVIIDLVDTKGRSLSRKTVNASSVKEGFDLSNFDSGIYYIKLQAGEDLRVLKMVKL